MTPRKLEADVRWVQSGKADSRKVGFLDLPRELRDLVYEFACRVAGAIFIFSPDHYSTRPTSTRPISMSKVIRYKNEGPLEPQPINSIIPIALMRTCRQLHAECSGVLYGSNIFRLYTSHANFGPAYYPLVRHITYTTEADYRIYGHDLETVAYWWRKRFWPDIVDRSTRVLLKFSNVETLTFPIKSNRLGQTWRPAFLAMKRKTREQRVTFAARWMKARSPIDDERLRSCLYLELVPSSTSSSIPKDMYAGSRFFPEDDEDEWDPSEFAEAFEKMKTL